MPKTKAEPTAKQKAFDGAKDAHDKATVAETKASNAQTKKALETAENNLKEARAALYRENFERVGGARVAKALEAIANVGKIAASKQYGFNAGDVEKMEKALTEAVTATVAKFRTAGTKTAKGAKAGFQF